MSATLRPTGTVRSMEPVRSPLRHIDVDTVTVATRREVRARQRHLPPVSTYRWWARRSESVTGAIVDAVAADSPGHLLIADPFAGGGVIVLATLLRGHRIYAQDVNPWAARSLATMLTLPEPGELAAAAHDLHDANVALLRRAYATTLTDGTPAELVTTLRVATGTCPGCGETLRLFPGAVVSLVTRVDVAATDTGFVVCPTGHLQSGPVSRRSRCRTCHRLIDPAARYTTDRALRCVRCSWSGKLAGLTTNAGFGWEPVLVERFGDGRRELGVPTAAEVAQAQHGWSPARSLPVIEDGEETGVLLRHGMRHWHDLYPARQRVVLEALLATCRTHDDAVWAALESAVIGSVEMAGHLSRWDPRYLKAYEAVANHRFNFTTLAAEPHVWSACGRGTVVRRLEQLKKAALFLTERIGRALRVDGPLESSRRRSPVTGRFDARVVSGASQRLILPAASLDAVVTDPPYHDDVQYGELSDLFRAWAALPTGRLVGEAVVESVTGRCSTNSYEAMLTEIFTEVRRCLKPAGHVVLSYANREPRAWVALLTALQLAGFRAAGYTVVHSENETDHAKTGKRACTLDVLIDVVPAAVEVYRHEPLRDPVGAEEEFCRVVGRWVLQIGHLHGDWAEQLTVALRATRFLSSPHRTQRTGAQCITS